MEYNQNPFRYGADFDPDNIVGRKDEMARVVHAIRDGQRLFLIGPRGFGKTSLLLAAQANQSQKGAIVLYVNAETSPDIAKLVGEIVAGTAAQIYEGAEDGIQKAGRFFSHLEPTFRLSADQQAISVSIGIDLLADKYRQMEVLADTLDSLNRLAQSLPESQPLALIIDEFSALVARFGVTAEAQIRAVVQRHRNVGYIFAGSGVGLMTDMTTKYSRPFYQSGDNFYLRPVPSADFVMWLSMQFKYERYATEESDPVHRILSLAEDVPYNVQMLAHNLLE
jgi:AAA+ ATPase superfamily predicted ATPase